MHHSTKNIISWKACLKLKPMTKVSGESCLKGCNFTLNAATLLSMVRINAIGPILAEIESVASVLGWLQKSEVIFKCIGLVLPSSNNNLF